MTDLEKIPFGNGGGSVKTLADVGEACQTPMTEVEVGLTAVKLVELLFVLIIETAKNQRPKSPQYLQEQRPN